MALDLAKTYFIIGIRRSLDAHDVFMVVARFVAELLAHVNHRAHVYGIGSRRQCPHDLRGARAALEMDGIGAAVCAGVVHECILRHAAVVIGVVVNPADEIIPSGRLLIDSAGFKVIAEEAAASR